jgi:hypothetical protein
MRRVDGPVRRPLPGIRTDRRARQAGIIEQPFEQDGVLWAGSIRMALRNCVWGCRCGRGNAGMASILDYSDGFAQPIGR